jgi:uncharacterized protein (TIGR02268 family)
VPLTLPSGLLALALLAAPPDATGPSSEDSCELASPRLVLTDEPTAKPWRVCIGPGLPLTFQFDGPLEPGSEKVEQRERFEDVSVGRRTLNLVPPGNLEAGEHFHVEVCFADGAAPACATFLLLAHPGFGMSKVEVFRQSGPLAYYQQEAREARSDNQRLREEVRQLRAEHGLPDGLRGVLASGLTRDDGIACKDLLLGPTERQGKALRPKGGRTCRAKGRVAVDLTLTHSSAAPWTAAGAVLRGAGGEVLKPLALWQPEPLLPSEPGLDEQRWGRVVVEVQAAKEEARGTYTLTLWDAEKKRTVSLGGVTFP